MKIFSFQVENQGEVHENPARRRAYCQRYFNILHRQPLNSIFSISWTFLPNVLQLTHVINFSWTFLCPWPREIWSNIATNVWNLTHVLKLIKATLLDCRGGQWALTVILDSIRATSLCTYKMSHILSSHVVLKYLETIWACDKHSPGLVRVTYFKTWNHK